MTELTAQELEKAGWSVVMGPEPGKTLNVSTRIPHWWTMNWAEQTLHQAAYGYDGHGALFIPDDALRDTRNRTSITRPRQYQNSGERYAIPSGPLHGSDDRLRRLLQDHQEWEEMRAREGSIVWRGPDGSILHTCPEGWGIPGLVEEKPLYCEFGEQGKLCLWEGQGNEQPAWSAQPPWESFRDERSPGPLPVYWKLESTTEVHGIRHDLYRDVRHVLGESLHETDDGNHRLRWRRKQTRARLVHTTSPGKGWEVIITCPPIPKLNTIVSKRDGETEHLGSVWHTDVAYVTVHDYVRRTFGRNGG